MAYQGQESGDIRATLALSEAEASAATQRKLNLPDGRQVAVTIPAGTRDGQEIRMEGQGLPTGYANRRGALILTIAIARGEQAAQTFPRQDNDSPTEFLQPYPPPPPQAIAPAAYPSTDQRGSAAQTAYPQSFATDRTRQAGPSQVGYNPPPIQPSPQRKGISRGAILLILMLVLLIVGTSGIILNATVIQPAQIHAQATSTALAGSTATAQQQTTGTAQVVASRSAADNATSTALAQATLQAGATATALQNMYAQATSGTPGFNDLMTQQDSNQWEVDNKTGGGGCAFSGGSYHVSMPQAGFFAPCYAQKSNFSNFAYQVQLTILKGDQGGLIFRSDRLNKFYLFSINQNGQYDLFLYTGGSNSNAKNLAAGTAANTFHSGLNTLNTLTVIARNSNIFLYINQQYVAGASDATFSSGSIGVLAEDNTHATEVVVGKVQIWQL